MTSVFSAVSQPEDSGFRLETRKLRRATLILRKGGGMKKVPGRWPRIKSSSNGLRPLVERKWDDSHFHKHFNAS